MKMMPKSFKSWRFIILLLLLFYSLTFLGCDKIQKCYPQVDVKKGYVGFKCTGEW